DSGAPLDGPIITVLSMEKRLVYNVLGTLGVPVTAGLRRVIGRPATRSFAAFMAFSRGLDYEAQGLMNDAAAAYREALRLDPAFTLAQERSDVVSANTEAQGQLERL